MAYRIDLSELKPVKRLDDGRVIVDGRLTRTGVFVYKTQDGKTIREYRPPEEVFSQQSMDSFAFAPVTDDHPGDFVTAENAKTVAVGAVGETVRRDGDHVAAMLTVFDAATVKKMDAGKVQLSCGYLADVEMKSGVTPQGEKYDAIQRNIKGNHVALVDVGRAGPTACVRMDTQVAVMDSLAIDFNLDTSGSQEKMDLKELTENYAKALAMQAQAEARADVAEKSAAKIPELEKELAEAQAKADSLAAELDAEKAARKEDAEKALTEVKARLALEAEAESVLKEKVKADATDREIKMQVVAKLDGAEIAAEKSDEYVNVRYDMAIEKFRKTDRSNPTPKPVKTEDIKSDSAESKREEMIKRLRGNK